MLEAYEGERLVTRPERQHHKGRRDTLRVSLTSSLTGLRRKYGTFKCGFPPHNLFSVQYRDVDHDCWSSAVLRLSDELQNHSQSTFCSTRRSFYFKGHMTLSSALMLFHQQTHRASSRIVDYITMTSHRIWTEHMKQLLMCSHYAIWCLFDYHYFTFPHSELQIVLISDTQLILKESNFPRTHVVMMPKGDESDITHHLHLALQLLVYWAFWLCDHVNAWKPQKPKPPALSTNSNRQWIYLPVRKGC